MALIGNTREEQFLNFFRLKGFSDYGIAGLYGNVLCESGLIPNNLQNTFNSSLGMTDEEYTKAVDNGTYTNFIYDSAGYGICQWTYWSRKQTLLLFAQSTKRSIGDFEMQLDFLYKELCESYSSVVSVLQNAKSVKEASNSVLLNFERPANQSIAVQNKRATEGQNFFDKYVSISKENNLSEVTKLSNSSLSCMRVISPNRNSPRNHVIDTITIHCVVGQMGIDALCSEFSRTSKGASCNYGIGYDGRICTIVDEADRSWCSSSPSNDNRAITIECASDGFYPYAINANVWKSLINLCADICKRNNIKQLKWQADKNLVGQVNLQNMTAHRWFDNKSCPGDYIYNRLSQIAKEVNQKLGNVTVPFKAYQGQVNADDGLNCRTSPVNGQVLKTYLDGTVVVISQEDGNWGYTGEGWVCLDYINKIASANDPDTKEEDIMDGKQFTKLWNEMRKVWQDNDASGYSEEARKWAIESGLIAGTGKLDNGEQNYAWADILTREQLVTVLFRFARMMGQA